MNQVNGQVPNGPPIGPQPCGCVNIATPQGTSCTLCMKHAFEGLRETLTQAGRFAGAASLAAERMQAEINSAKAGSRLP